jgi:hypothetical protein
MTTLAPEMLTGADVQRWMTKHGYDSDIKLATALGVARTTIFNWRHDLYIQPWLGPALDGLIARKRTDTAALRGPVKVEVEIDTETGEATVLRSRRLTRAR